MAKNFGNFTDEASPALTDRVVGYRTAASNGERRTLLTAIKNLFKVSYDLIYCTGPASAVNGQKVLFNGTTGKLVKVGGKTYAGAGAPGATEDAASGYVANDSIGFDTDAQTVYWCSDSTNGAAVWQAF
jgi:hypothetical protein